MICKYSVIIPEVSPNATFGDRGIWFNAFPGYWLREKCCFNGHFITGTEKYENAQQEYMAPE
jgi:hypothetical protein